MELQYVIHEGLDWLERWNRYAPSAVALKDGESGFEISYKKFFELSCRGAAFLQKNFKIQRGDRVALLATNEWESLVLFFSLQRLGAALVPINFRLTERELDHILTDCDPSLIVYQSSFQNRLENLKPTLGGKSKLLLQGSQSFSNALSEEHPNEKSFQKIYSSQFADPALILYTSGTTGFPKGAIISHQMIFWNSVNTSLRLNLSQNDSTVIFLPLFHTGGWNVLTTPFFHRGGKIILLRKFDADLILNLCERERTTILFGVPTTMDLLAQSPLFSSSQLSSLRYAIVGGEPMPIDLIRTWEKKNIPIRQGYGLTEFGPNVFSLNEEDSVRKIGSIGFPNFYIETRVVDDQGEDAPTNEVGELWLKGPMMMSGYWRNDKATAETIQDSWLKTGDLVRKDDEGYFYVVGRKKEMYISGGENVYPVEIEHVLRSCPGVQEAAVVGIPDEKWGEVGQAFIVKSSSSLTEEILQSHCLKNLAKFKIPKKFVFLPHLPKSDSGKILKRELSR